MDKSHMDNNDNVRLDEALDEVFLRHMMQDYMQHRGEQLLAEEASLPDTEDCKPTAKQMKRLTRKLKKAARQSGYQVRRIPRKALPLVVALVALLAISLITAGAHRFKLFNFLNVPGNLATEYGAQDIEDREYEFGYMPEGFSERFYNVTPEGIRTYYVNINDENQYVQLIITENAQRISPDTEDAETVEEILVNELPGRMTWKDDLVSVVWADKTVDAVYLLQSSLDQTEVLKIAEGISKK